MPDENSRRGEYWRARELEWDWKKDISAGDRTCVKLSLWQLVKGAILKYHDQKRSRKGSDNQGRQ
jgi:hypothetical protein